MEWDLGLQGIGLLLLMAAGFAAVVQLVLWRKARWWWAVALPIYFAAGLFVSEFWFGWATEEDLQPNINGLSFDEVLLLAPLIAIPIMLAAWWLATKTASHQPVLPFRHPPGSQSP